jgi:hypothetical protein
MQDNNGDDVVVVETMKAKVRGGIRSNDDVSEGVVKDSASQGGGG